MVSVVERETCVSESERGQQPPTGRASTIVSSPDPASRAELVLLLTVALKVLQPMRYPAVGAAYRQRLCHRILDVLAREPKAIDAKEIRA